MASKTKKQLRVRTPKPLYKCQHHGFLQNPKLKNRKLETIKNLNSIDLSPFCQIDTLFRVC